MKKMKKFISILAAVCVCFTSTISFAADSQAQDMSQTLITVKEKIDIPSEAKNFESSSYEADGKNSYGFRWYDDNMDMDISVDCDADGHIKSYSFYTDHDESPSLSPLSKEDIFKVGDSFVKKALPELFSNESDRLVYNESDSTGSAGYGESRYTFYYNRIHDGTKTYANGATVRVAAVGKDVYVTSMDCNWNYSASFKEASEYDGDIEKKYFDEYPLELVYEKSRPWSILKSVANDGEAKLVYRFKDNESGYISAETGEKIVADSDSILFKGSNAFAEDAMASMSGGGSAARDYLTEAEIKEIENVSGLISKSDAEKILRSIPEFCLDSSIKVNSFSVRNEKESNDSKGKYIININMDSNENEDYGYAYASLDAQSGEILYFTKYSKNESNGASEREIEKAKSASDNFVKRICADKSAQTEISMQNADDRLVSTYYTRIVNGVKYADNGIRVNYVPDEKYVSYYNVTWDDDVSDFENPSGAVAPEEAVNTVKGDIGLENIYVLSGGEFIKCIGLSKNTNFRIDAVTGKLIGAEFSVKTPEYDDIDGHWCEQSIRTLSSAGIFLDGDSFRPEDEITQADLLRFLMKGFFRYISSQYSVDEMYEELENRGIISENERNDESPVSREDAFMYTIRFMGYEKIAKMDIFKVSYSDAQLMSPDKFGYAALLSGFGVIGGDGGKIRPTEKITRAETAAIIYNYLTNN